MRGFTLLVALLSLALTSQCYLVDVTSFSPSHAHIGGQDTVTINGYGFRTHSEVICIWGGQWKSPSSVINSDTQITCQTPVIPKDQALALPFSTSLFISFDGSLYDPAFFITDDFGFGPIVQSYAPQNGYTTGGETFVVNGQYFSDFSTARVTFNGRLASNTSIISDTSISCVVPPGEFNEYAVVNVIFDNEDRFFQHFTDTYHYGPVITSVTPPCGVVNGGTRITVSGFAFDDPILDQAQEPNGPPIVEVVFGNTRYFGIDVDLTPTNQSVVFTMPDIGSVVFGTQPEIYVFFRQVESKVAATNLFTFGGLVYSTPITPSHGHAGGGETITINGCGFRNYVNSGLSVNIGSTSLCVPSTIQITELANGNDILTCQTAPLSCDGGNSEIVTVSFGGSNTLPTDGSLFYSVGPLLSANSFAPLRGPRTGGTVVTITGSFFYETRTSAGWSLTVSFDAGSTNLPSVTGNILSDSVATFTVPAGLFDLDADISVSFGSSCPGLPYSGVPTFHYGPVCTTVSPSSGYLSGLQTVTINGEGFTENGNVLSSTEIRFCIDRLNPNDECVVYEPPPVNSAFTLASSKITVQTPSIRQNVSTVVGGNRLFGDQSSVWVHFLQPGSAGIEIPRNQLRPGLDIAIIECSIGYRFGAQLNSITPNEGPIGPRAPQSPGTPISISGLAFSDPAYNSDVLVSIDNDMTFSSTIVSDTLITSKTLWGTQESEQYSDVTAVFGTCNSTTTDVVVNWGPRIFSLIGDFGFPTNSKGDVYGISPNGGTVITINGFGFSGYVDEITCLVDNQPSPCYVDDDSTIYVWTPPAQFGSNATVAVVFGGNCGDLANWWMSVFPEYTQTIVATQRIFYTARIETISPLFGKTSGGDLVTITGEGFSGWGSYLCFFGQYTDGVEVFPNNDNLIVCRTPYQRGEFNTDVTVHLQLSAPANVFDFDQKTISPVRFHYGPICTALASPICQTTGCNNQAVLGSGFQDCSSSNEAPFRSCTFQSYQVQLVDPTTGAVVNASQTSSSTFASGNSDSSLSFNAPAASCMSNPTVRIYFPDALVSSSQQQYVTCANPNPVVLHYGPTFSGQSSQYYKSGVSYGWAGDSVTISGSNFRDAGIFTSITSITCLFGNAVGSTTFVDGAGQTLVCQAPAGQWGSLVQITVRWTGPSANCTGTTSLTAGKFHYGPVLLSSSPARGYVNAQTPITVTGFAFQCCGITSLSCLMPSPYNGTTTTSGDSVICPAPVNTNIGIQINNIGVKFTSSSFSNNLTLTETGTSLTFFYGPFVTSVSSQTTLSGRDQSITITGEGFRDPFFSLALCDFVSTTGGSNFTATTPIPGSQWDDTTIVCPVPTFSHNCGDIDQVRPRWRKSGPSSPQGNYYVPTVPPVLSAPQPVAPFFTNATSNVQAYVGPLNYGPVVRGVYYTDSTDLYPISGNYYTTVSASDLLLVSYDNLADFVSDPSGNFGSELALCKYGNRLGLNAVFDIFANPNDFTRYPSANEEMLVACLIPEGAFNDAGQLSVILNPKMDEGTMLVNTDGWHWLPYANRLSRRFGLVQGYETVVALGQGFCNYDSVVCLFDGVEGKQSDITNDHLVTCVAPPKFASVSTVQLRLTAASDMHVDTITVGDKYTFVGVTNINPPSGPTCGVTTVTISGFGFTQFDQLECIWGKQTLQGTVISDTTVTCPSIDVSQRTFTEDNICFAFSVVGTRNGQRYFLDIPFRFLFGTPEIVALTPSTVDIDQPSTVVTVSGEFFNSISQQQSDFQCRLGNNPAVEGQLVQQRNGEWTITCANLFNRTTAVVGNYPLEILFPCSSNEKFTTNRVPLRISQNPQVLTINPLAGPFIGGVKVTVKGSQFNGGTNYMCSFGDFRNKRNTLVSAEFVSSNEVVCLTPFTPVDENTAVELAISLDGGQTYVPAPDDYIVQDIDSYSTDDCPIIFSAAVRLSSSSIAVLLLLSILLISLL